MKDGTPRLSFRRAGPGDVATATALINSAYRGESSTVGWTTEAHLLAGRRIDEAGLRALIDQPDSLIFLCFQDESLIGSVLLQKSSATVGYIGMFVVRPGLQGAGIGRRFMAAAEAEAGRLWGVTRMSMSVITLRRELIAYYQRCGYRLTGEILPFPFEDGLSVALVDGIELAVMEKDLR
jgi:GNAT superfamily N-acetyltransferase